MLLLADPCCRVIPVSQSSRGDTVNTTTAAYRVLGTTDEVTTCDICGKVELKGTIVLGVLDADGNV